MINPGLVLPVLDPARHCLWSRLVERKDGHDLFSAGGGVNGTSLDSLFTSRCLKVSKISFKRNESVRFAVLDQVQFGPGQGNLVRSNPHQL